MMGFTKKEKLSISQTNQSVIFNTLGEKGGRADCRVLTQQNFSLINCKKMQKNKHLRSCWSIIGWKAKKVVNLILEEAMAGGRVGSGENNSKFNEFNDRFSFSLGENVLN